MNIQTAKRLLQDQSYKLSERSNWNQAWITQTASYIEKIFGSESQEFKHIASFTFALHQGLNEYTDEYNLRRDRHVAATQVFLANCIETLDIKGVYAPQKTNVLYRLDNNWLVPLCVTIVSAVWYLGYYYGVATTDYKNVDLTNKVKELRDSVSMGQRATQERVQYAADSISVLFAEKLPTYLNSIPRDKSAAGKLSRKEVEKALNEIKGETLQSGTR
ncbi:hypothetical protein SAMN04487996_107137 [Dyadobacter soli]|uniref:Uncharacterized protein n=1 Tax=Dyadobacter soli TaxID=659014 RepID=A0A1G7G603_9BACT|nr:hypothetical protein [Dyadobacter soli]SDE83561.1 hypothetical protein SAMN04487996_107137 [Dyadobacter soli]